METKEVTYDQLLQMVAALKTIDLTIEDKLTKAIQKFYKVNAHAFTEYNDKLEDINLDHCLTDPSTGAILKDEKGGFKFNKEALRAIRAEQRDLLTKTTTIKPFIATSPRVETMHSALKELLNGFVINYELEVVE